MPRPVVLVAQIALFAVMAFTMAYCGKKESSDESAPQPSVSGRIPADWDGTGDYANSLLTVVDE